METKIETIEEGKVKVTVTVPASEVDASVDALYKSYAKKYKFPGFRPGKAPKQIIDTHLGKGAVMADATEEIINKVFPLVVDQNDLYMVGNPDFLEPQAVECGKDYEFAFSFTPKPSFELSSYEPIAIEMPSSKASDEDIEAEIKELVENYYDFADAAEGAVVEEGGFVLLNVTATDQNGKNLENITNAERLYNLGTNMLPASFDKELIGLKKGSKKSFECPVVKADNVILFSSLPTYVTSVKFDLEVLSIKTKVYPELTDAWVEENFGFADIAELRTRMAESIESERAQYLPKIKENLIFGQLVERFQGEAPDSMVEDAESELLKNFYQQLQSQGLTMDLYLKSMNMTAPQFKADVKKQAVDQVKEDLALDAWAKAKGIKATPEEVEAEFVRSGADDYKALMQEWAEAGRLHLIREGICRTKALKDITDTVVVTEASEAPKKKATKKKAAKAEEAPAEAPAEEAAPAPKKRSTKKVAAPAEEVPAEAPVEEAAPAPKKRSTKKVAAPAEEVPAEAPVEEAAPAPKKRSTKKAAAPVEEAPAAE